MDPPPRPIPLTPARSPLTPTRPLHALHTLHRFFSSRLPELEVLRIFLGVCTGVNVLHNHTPPLAHRDIKPANVLLSNDGIPVLMVRQDLASHMGAELLTAHPSTRRKSAHAHARFCLVLHVACCVGLPSVAARTLVLPGQLASR